MMTEDELQHTLSSTHNNIGGSEDEISYATRKDHFHLPFIDQMLERLVGHAYYYFLHIIRKEFEVGQLVLLFNSRLRLFLGKLRSKWYGSYTMTQVFSYGAVEVKGQKGVTFNVNR